MEASIIIMASAAVLLGTGNVAMLVAASRSVTRAKLLVDQRFAGASEPQSAENSLIPAGRLPADALAGLQRPSAPGLIAVLSESCPACVGVGRRLARAAPRNLDVVFTEERWGSLHELLSTVGHIVQGASRNKLLAAMPSGATPIVLSRSGDGEILWGSAGSDLDIADLSLIQRSKEASREHD